jgi:peptidoglycan hydrolase-like protein with peptidoglycan-binding domain
MTCTTPRVAGAGLAVAAALAFAAPASANRPVPEGGSSPPRVNMERVLLAAQLDPHRASGKTTRGARKSVARVQRALIRKGLLAHGLADGSFGPVTLKAYAAWQRRLGYSGLGATGLPGPTSLTKLGAGRYKVIRAVSPGAKVYYGRPGGRQLVNLRTKHMLIAAAHKLGPKCRFSLYQGSYHPGTGASAGTHDGGGAADINPNLLCGKHVRRAVRALRQVGFAAWNRPTIPGLWVHHIHAIAISDPDMAPAAQAQIWDYYHGMNGLTGHGPDTGPKVPKRTWEQYKRLH